MSRIFDRRKIVKRLKEEGWKLSKKHGKGSHEWYEQRWQNNYRTKRWKDLTERNSRKYRAQDRD